MKGEIEMVNLKEMIKTMSAKTVFNKVQEECKPCERNRLRKLRAEEEMKQKGRSIR